MRFETNDKIEEFFVDGVNADVVFSFVKRTDYYFLYKIIHSQCVFEDGKSVYLSDFAAELELPVTYISKLMHILVDKGYVTWHTDDKKERSYVTLTGKATDLMQKQKDLMIESYKRIVELIPSEELKMALETMGHIRRVISDVKEIKIPDADQEAI